MVKLSQLLQEPTIELSDRLLKVKTAAGGDALVQVQDFLDLIPSGYVLPLINGNIVTSPTDGQTLFFGAGSAITNGPQALGNSMKLFIPRSGRITAVSGFVIVAGTLGSAEHGSMYVRINNTTDQLISNSISYTALQNPFTVSGLDIDVTAGDYIIGKIISPTWATNPTSVEYMMNVYISA